MATIALNAANMNQMSELLTDLQGVVKDFKSQLASIGKKTLTINSSVCNIEDIISSIQVSTQTQEQKIDSIDTLAQSIEEFTEEVVKIDGRAAEVVRKRKDDFYKTYSYLKPESEKSWLEWAGDFLVSVGEACRKNWKKIALYAGTIICIAICLVVCPASGTFLYALIQTFWYGQLIGGTISAGWTALCGGTSKEVVDSFYDGAFLGGFGSIMAVTLSFPAASLSLGETMSIGGMSAAFATALGYWGDQTIKGEEITNEQAIKGIIEAAIFGAVLSGIFYGLSKGVHALRRWWRGRITGGSTGGNTGSIEGGSTTTNPYNLQPTHSQTLSNNKLNALMDDIKVNGIQEPIKYVEYNGQKYVVDGHHRLLAAKRLGLTEVPIERVELPYAGYSTIEDLLWFE